MKNVSLFTLLVAILAPLAAQEGIQISVTPSASIPLGPLADGKIPYKTGGGASLQGDWALPFVPFLRGGAVIGYANMPILSGEALSMVRMGASLSYPIQLAGMLGFELGAEAGYNLGLLGENVGSNFWAEAQAGLSVRLSSSMSLCMGASYREIPGLYRGADGYLTLRFSPGGAAPSKLEFRHIDLYPVFPVFYKHYDGNAFGTITIRNNEASEIRDVRVSLFVKSFMDAPKTYVVADLISKGQELPVPLYALFNQAILDMTEGSKASAEIEISYKRGRDEVRKKETVSLTVLYRNALTWDDDRKAASFVTAKDPAVLTFSKNIAGAVREADASTFILQFRQAMALFESLSVYGMNYVVDPASSYASLSANEAALDYLQFPSQSLSYRAGDCDDLSVLFCALLEASGIETAFITVPGHIFAAFNPGIAAEAAPRYFPRAGDYLVNNEKIWIPVEITMIHDGFLKAWQEGARQWKEALARNQAAIYPVREAWSLYEPTASVEEARVIAPDKVRVISRYADSWKRFTAREMADREKTLKEALTKRDTPANRNKLGVLYAGYGLYDQAEAQFAAGAKAQNLYCMINLANIRFVRADYAAALTGYQAALKMDARNPDALAGAARSEYERDNLKPALAWYEKLKEASPSAALAYAYIEKASASEDRASATGARMAMEWME